MAERRVMLITGSRKGIGLRLAEHYVQEGYHVVGCSRSPSDFRAEGYEHHELDVRNEPEVIQLFGHIRRKLGGLSVLINNAGVAVMNHALLTPISAVQRILETNVTATFLCCREAAKLFRRGSQSRIVNLSSVAVPLQLEGEAIYAASKAAVESLTRVLARELGALGVTCNAVGPSPVKTDLIRSVPQETIERLIARQAIRRYTEPEDVINVVDFFIDPKSEFVTGQVIYLGGVS